jgi:hypothetical protein
MWILLLVFLNSGDLTGDLSQCKDRGLIQSVDECMAEKGWTAGGTRREKVIEKFHTQEECQKERDRIGKDMAGSYEHVHDFDMVCEFRARVI